MPSSSPRSPRSGRSTAGWAPSTRSSRPGRPSGGNIVFTNGDPTERDRSTTHPETVLRWGAGTQFELTDCSWLRLEWQRQEDIGKAFRVGGSGTTGEAHTDAVFVGFYYRF